MKTSSIWGKAPQRLYKLIQIAEKNLNKDFSSCIVGCSDGKFLFPFARKKHFVIGYEIDKIALNGGKKDFPPKRTVRSIPYSGIQKFPPLNTQKVSVIGIRERIRREKLEKFCYIEERDFYKTPPNKKFDIVFTSCSLHYTLNSSMTLQEKVKKLQNLVKENGYLYIDYMMAIDEKNFLDYPKNKFFRRGEIRKYFSTEWEILFIKENKTPSFEAAHVECVFDHYHKFGYILAKKKPLVVNFQKEICWNITPKCNQNCQYCLKFLGINELSLNENVKVLHNLKKCGVNEITWGGGEPLIYRYIDELLELSHRLGIKNKVVSNGSLLTNDRIDKIIHNIDILTISLDSISSDINDKLGRGKKHFMQVNNVIKYIQAHYPQTELRINTVINAYNYNCIDELISYLNEVKVYAWRIFKVMPLRERAIENYHKLSVTMDCFNKVKKQIHKGSKILNIDFREIDEMESSYILLIANADIMKTQNNQDIKIGNALKDDLKTLKRFFKNEI